jgi:hypothetical protein
MTTTAGSSVVKGTRGLFPLNVEIQEKYFNCFWCLVVFHEDDCRVRQGHATQYLAIIRHFVLSLLKQESSAKREVGGLKIKRNRDR